MTIKKILSSETPLTDVAEKAMVSAEFSRRIERERAALIASLRECAHAIGEELSACDTDEVREHPTLRAHKRAHDKATRLLARLSGGLQP